ncbi:SDR family NAD(P)-dependent oxidoreductase [Corynebacterium sp. H78]|uniref:SDR family NAD(P)-dependent oxidoreductase n=1 Tax=Corynebacterium sp. H78 TaxID=3133417 RepID=UPI00309B263F
MRNATSRHVWTLADMPDLTGQTWLITGATRGLGLETARAACAAGAHLILAVRNTERGDDIAAQLGNAEVVALDLADLRSVRAAATQVLECGHRIDVLVNNAGGSTTHRTETRDGFEWHLGVNVLGPFLFTNLILDRVLRRVVIVASTMHRFGKFDFSDPHFRNRPWHQVAAYSQSKLGNLLWAHELTRRLQADRRGVDVQISHPGWANTAMGNPARTSWGKKIVAPASSLLANPTQQAALTTLFAATQSLPPCSFIGPDGIGGLRGYPTVVRPAKKATDDALAQQLWDFAASETQLAK